MDLVTKDLYHSLGFFLIFPLVYRFIQTLPLINYVVINPCCCRYLFHLNKFVLASWLRTKAFLNSCRCRNWPQVNCTFNPLGISHFSSSKVHIFLFCNNVSLHTCSEFLFGACLIQPVLQIQRLGAAVVFGLGLSAGTSHPLQTVKHPLDALHALLELGQQLKYKTISPTSYTSARFPGVT